MKKNLLLAGVALACLTSVFLWMNSSQANFAASKAKAENKSQPKQPRPRIADSVAIVPADYDWGAMDKETLGGLATYYSSMGLKTVKGFSVNTTLKLGESFIPRIYELRPGEFVMTKITPRRATDSNGHEVIQMDFSSFTYGGTETGENIRQTLTIVPGSINTVFGTDSGGTHSIKVRTSLSGNPNEIHVSATGKYQQLCKSPNTSN